MDWNGVFVAVGMMAGLGFTLASVLAIANKKLYVYEDPRIDDVEGMLPGANCGACGFPGCRPFAEELVAGNASPGGCTVSAVEAQEEIAEYLGVDVGGGNKIVARLACAGGTHVARQRVRYEGLQSCRGADLVAGGGKGCAWGCLGLADCEAACDFDAIHMNQYSLPVVDALKCTACGDCVEICPRDLFSLHPVSQRLWVACKSEAVGDEAEDECAVACTACGRCVSDAPPGLLEMKNNLPIIQTDQLAAATPSVIQRCPTGAIVWIDDQGEFIKGREAKEIIRKEPLPLG